MAVSARRSVVRQIVRVSLLCTFLLAPPALFELALAAPLPTIIYLAYGALSVPLLWLGSARHGSAWASGLVAGLVAALCCLHLVPWTSRKEFLERFAEVRPGMPVAAVERALAPYAFQESNLSAKDTVRSYVHSRAPEFDSDWGIVRFRAGRVVGTEFLPD